VKLLRVALETQFAAGTPTGLGVYAQKVASSLRARGDIELVELEDARYDVWRFDRRVFWDQFAAPRLARKLRANVIHFTGGTLPLWTPHPCVLTLHDLAWLGGAVTGRAHSRWYFGTLQRRLAHRADRIAADTEVSRNEIVKRLGMSPSKVAVTGAGVDDAWFKLERRRSDPPYFLAVGTVEARKDLETAVRAIVSLAGVRLVSVGPQTKYAARVLAVARELAVADRVELRGYVSEETLHELYAGATALVFPSRYEGFGLPPLQALAAGVPVVAADIPVLREVLGDCALWARPGDAESFTDRLRQALAHDPGLREMGERGRMHARQLTWATVADRLVRVYRSLM
jgi:glycosyltransferase involved in cell wall biosynthesis